MGFILFDVKVGPWWLYNEDVCDIAESFSIPVTPIVGEGTLEEAIEFVKAGFISLISQNREYQAEGVVVRPDVQFFSRSWKRIISKIKTRDF